LTARGVKDREGKLDVKKKKKGPGVGERRLRGPRKAHYLLLNNDLMYEGGKDKGPKGKKNVGQKPATLRVNRTLKTKEATVGMPEFGKSAPRVSVANKGSNQKGGKPGNQLTAPPRSREEQDFLEMKGGARKIERSHGIEENKKA